MSDDGKAKSGVTTTPSLAPHARLPSALDRPLGKGKGEVPLSTYALLFCELVQYQLAQAATPAEIEAGLHRAGYGIGVRVLELLCLREGKQQRRDRAPVALLQWIHSAVWRALFGAPADGLEKSNEGDGEYYIFERDPLPARFVSVPRHLAGLNVAAFTAGIVNGVLDGAECYAEVTAGWNAAHTQTVYVVKLLPPAQGK